MAIFSTSSSYQRFPIPSYGVPPPATSIYPAFSRSSTAPPIHCTRRSTSELRRNPRPLFHLPSIAPAQLLPSDSNLAANSHEVSQSPPPTTLLHQDHHPARDLGFEQLKDLIRTKPDQKDRLTSLRCSPSAFTTSPSTRSFLL